ncbi:MAG: class II glutamine amidotransferase [Alphaproteobacteria bacterium]|nr:class II glutamine amidotransferase [Alphaproteobacteria bacterium]
MCELFALSANATVDVKLSLGALARHGGGTGPHRDGWGVAFGDGKDFRLFKEAGPAWNSPLIECLAAHPVRSRTVLAHIRHATRGPVAAENTQPFVRELGGMLRVFAHNGNLGAADPADASRVPRFMPVGETDSEAAFCSLLNEATGEPAKPLPFELFARFAKRARDKGPANFIYAEPGRLLVHADRRTQASGAIEPPGLWMLGRSCMAEPPPASPVTVGATADTVVALFASVPLTGEAWVPIERGTIIEAANGHVARTERAT